MNAPTQDPAATLNIQNALQKAREALSEVVNNDFSEDLAKYTAGGMMTQSAKDAIEEYQAMVYTCKVALDGVNEILPV